MTHNHNIKLYRSLFEVVHFFGFTFLLLVSFVSLRAQTVRINEFMAVNSTTVADKDGDYSDWIELFNPTTEPVNLAGWSLTDDIAAPRKWIFPDVSLLNGNYLLLFASDKDMLTPATELHTNFKLNGSGEYLALIDEAGTIVTEFAPAYSAQVADISFAYFDGDYIFSTSPTPGTANRFEAHGMLPPPIANPSRGFFQQAFEVELTTELENAELYYTLDGSEPTAESGILYEQPIPINTTSVLRAMVSLPDNLSSPSTTHTYLFLDDVLVQPNDPSGYPDTWGPYTAISGTAIADYEMDPEIIDDPRYAPYIKEALLSLPTMSLVTQKEYLFSNSKSPERGGIYIYTGPPEGGDVPGFGDGWERPASIEFFTSDGSEEFQVNCGVRLQGGHSRRPEKSPKHSFRLVFKSKYGPTRLDYPLFGPNAAESFNTVTLRAGFCNKWFHWSHPQRKMAQYLRDVWAKDTQLEMGHTSGHGRFVHLYINGMYWGLYNPTERIDRRFAESYFGGDDEDYDVIKDYAGVIDGTNTAWNRMITLANRGLASTENYQRIQGNNPDGTPNSNYEAYVDVINLIDYMILNFYGGNTDWDHHNWVAIRNRVGGNKGFKFFSWDAEHVVESKNENVTNENNDNRPSDLFQELAKNDDFQRLFADRVQYHCYNGGVLTPEANIERWMKRADEIDLAVIAESARWGDYRRDVHRYNTQGPFDLYDKQYWLEEQDYVINDYFPNRTDILLNQLRAAGLFPNLEAPIFQLNNEPIESRYIKPGDILGMSSTTGSIYYTTDGSDPFLFQSGDPGTETTLVPEHALKRVMVPKSTISQNWQNRGYNDASWRLCRGAPGGVGYEKDAGYENLISLDVGDDMHDDGSNPNTSCLIRIAFSLQASRLEQIKSLNLEVFYDDGFVAFLNGTRIAQANAPATLQWNSSATANHEAESRVSFNISQFIDRLEEGENVLAFHGLNTNTSSSDFLINATLVAGDQKGSGGTISPNAILYSEPIELEYSTHIKARSLLGNDWSALNEMMLVSPSDLYNLRFTEIHYHPAVEDTIDNRSLEFLELKNIGRAPVDLSGAQFAQGIIFNFPTRTILNPGEFVVLASNPQQFNLRYGFVPLRYEGFLANEGETLTLINIAKDTILTVSYDDSSPWPEDADGFGYSLVPKDRNPDPHQDNAILWKRSATIHGSPGKDDPASTQVEHDDEFLPDAFRLEQNYPNPFNPGTTITYTIPKQCFVNLTIFDVLGREVRTVVDNVQEVNVYRIWIDMNQLPSGLYFYRLQAGADFTQTKKMLLVR